MIEVETSPQHPSYEDFAKTNPTEARAGELLARYRLATTLQHSFFYDEELYEIIKGEVNNDVINHYGTNLFSYHLDQRRRSLGGLRSPSDRFSSLYVDKVISQLEEELQTWKHSHAEEATRIAELLQSILSNGTENIDRETMIAMVKDNPYLIVGLSLALEIYTERQKLQTLSPPSVPDASDSPPTYTGTARERREAYLRRQRGEG